MKINDVKIVADSSGDILDLSDVAFAAAPLKVCTEVKEYVDDAALDVGMMVRELEHYHGRSSTSCPSPSDYLTAYGDAKYVFCVTITATLSGSYNAAMVAKHRYEEMHPDRRVFVLNSLSADPEICLFIERLQEVVLDGMEFDAICDAISEYRHRTGLVFMLESMKNLANNGRVSPLVAKMAGLLGIRVVGKASERGDLEPLNKCRGEKKALVAILKRMKEIGYSGGRVLIDHCFNPGAAKQLKEMILREFDSAKISVGETGGLCTFYAENGGLLVGFEIG